jgi:hypothetical protein
VAAGPGWRVLYKAPTTYPLPCHEPSRQDEVSDADYDADEEIRIAIQPGLLTHLTRLTRLCTRPDVVLTNDPAVLPTAGSSLRVLELACDTADYAAGNDFNHNPRACMEALLPVAAGLEALDICESRLTPADAVRLAAALPQGIARLRINTDVDRVWSALPITSLKLGFVPDDLTLLAGAPRLGQLSVSSLVGVEPVALAAALQAMPRLRMLQLGDGWRRAFEEWSLFPPDAGEAPPPTADAIDAFVAAVASLPHLLELTLAGFHIGSKAKAALLEAASRLSALRLAVCGLSGEATAGLGAQLRAAAGNGSLSLEVRAWVNRFVFGGQAD